MARSVLVTGGAGFIGSNIAEALVERGDRVRVLDNLSSGNLANLAGFENDVEFVQGDVGDAAIVAKAMQGIDLVFHQAALASVPMSVAKPLASHAACATGTLNVLHEARLAGVRRVVYAASSSAYGNQPTASKRESDPVMPLSPYGAAKLAGEAYCQAFASSYPIETVCLRYFNVFGPRQDPNGEYSAVIPKFITLMLEGKRPTIFGDGLQSRDFVYIANVVRGNLLAADAPQASGRVINMATGSSVSLLELLRQLNRLLKMDVQPHFEPARAGDVRDSQADITLARQLLKYEPEVSFGEGLERSIEYYLKVVRGG